MGRTAIAGASAKKKKKKKEKEKRQSVCVRASSGSGTHGSYDFNREAKRRERRAAKRDAAAAAAIARAAKAAAAAARANNSDDDDEDNDELLGPVANVLSWRQQRMREIAAVEAEIAKLKASHPRGRPPAKIAIQINALDERLKLLLESLEFRNAAHVQVTDNGWKNVRRKMTEPVEPSRGPEILPQSVAPPPATEGTGLLPGAVAAPRAGPALPALPVPVPTGRAGVAAGGAGAIGLAGAKSGKRCPFVDKRKGLCGKPHHALDLCENHYKQFKNNRARFAKKDPAAAAQAQKRLGEVDRDDYDNRELVRAATRARKAAAGEGSRKSGRKRKPKAAAGAAAGGGKAGSKKAKKKKKKRAAAKKAIKFSAENTKGAGDYFGSRR